MNKYKIQIIIPVYNAEKYLRKCLDSVKNQTFTDWQAILVDDCSVDGSRDIIDEYVSEDSRFVCVKQSENAGAANARNTALSMLDGEYTAFLDSDDYWENSMLEVLINKAQQYSCDVVQCRFIYDFSGGKTVTPTGAFSADTMLEGKGLRSVYIKMMTGINMNHVCMKLIRTSLLKGMEFDKTLKTAEDLKFCIQLFKNVKKYYFTDNVLYHYRRCEESLTGKGLSFAKKLEANRRVSKELAAALPVWGIDNIFYKFLSYTRPYIIIVSKILRMVREKLLTKKQ